MESQSSKNTCMLSQGGSVILRSGPSLEELETETWKRDIWRIAPEDIGSADPCKPSESAKVVHSSQARARFLEDATKASCLQGNKHSPQELPLSPSLAVILMTRVKSQHSSTGNMLSLIRMDGNSLPKKFPKLASMY